MTITAQERLETLKRLDYLKRFVWDCGTRPCDGRPHGDHPYKHARTSQLPPEGDDWYGFFMMSGRGSGKTRAGAEYCKKVGMAHPNSRIAIVAPTISKAREACYEGESGLRGLYDGQGCIPWEYIANYNRSMGELNLTNGTQFKSFSADDEKSADLIRGYQAAYIWYEELAACPAQDHAWAMGNFALRLGEHPHVIITSTPRPTKLIKKLVADPDIHVTYGSLYDNADNLPAIQVARLKRMYENTSLGEQELHGRLLDEAIGALWKLEMFRPIESSDVPDLVRVVIGVDPAGSHKKNSDETGIVAVGIDAAGCLYVLRDRSGRYTPEEWANVVAETYEEVDADRVVAERNYGGDLVESNLRHRHANLPLRTVHASKGKLLRAEPVVSLYERGIVFHVGDLKKLESQQLEWIPPGRHDADGDPIPPSAFSPDRLDATVYACTDLALAGKAKRGGMRYFG